MSRRRFRPWRKICAGTVDCGWYSSFSEGAGYVREILLVGNPNCGKTTLFNVLCGARQKTANWPGVSVGRVSGMLSERWRRVLLPCGAEETESSAGGRFPAVLVTDLPGLYAGEDGSLDEQLAARCIREHADAAVLCVADAAAPVRGVALACQIASEGRRVVLALNFADEAARRGVLPDCETLRELTGIPCALISARRREGIEKLIQLILSEPEDTAKIRGFAGTDGSGYEFLAFSERVCREAGAAARRDSRTDCVDRILTHPAAGLAVLVAVLAAVLWLSFSLGGRLGEWVSDGVSVCADEVYFRLSRSEMPASAVSLIARGVIPGVGAALSFAPGIVILFLLLALLEDSGYMARAALAADPLLAPCGLSGRAAIPLVLGLGCTVPALSAARVMEDHPARVRLTAALPLLPCSARLPVYGMLAWGFFGRAAPAAIAGLYTVSFLAFFLYLRLCGRRDADSALLIELPPYRMPDGRTVLRTALTRTWDCLSRACSVIFLSSAALWFLLHFSPTGFCSGGDGSFAYRLGAALSPLLAPVGLDFPPVAAALAAGIAAKENIVSSLAVLLGGISPGQIPAALAAMGFSRANALSCLVFAALYCPCIASLITRRKETNSVRRALRSAAGQTALAYICSAAVYRLAVLFL